jgi:hypothetical protein
MGTTIEDPETRIVEELARPKVEAELPELPAELWVADKRPELLACGIVVPDEPRLEIETGLESEGDTLGGLEDPNTDVNWMVPLLTGLGTCHRAATGNWRLSNDRGLRNTAVHRARNQSLRSC